jgi:hypothetical protein
MRKFFYLIAEGVLDVVVLSEIMRHRYSLAIVARKADLEIEAAKWLDQFKWPVGEDISRMAVPAPVFLQSEQWIVAVRNARGISEIGKKMRADDEAFLRIGWKPLALAIVLDADDKPPSERFAEFATLLESWGLPKPDTLGSMTTTDSMRTGIFAFPGDEKNGTIEDVIIPVGEMRFPTLFPHAYQYVEKWPADVGPEFAELTTSGRKKAVLSAMAALLKPGRNLNASIQDHAWMPHDPHTCPALKPILAFLDAFFA